MASFSAVATVILGFTCVTLIIRITNDRDQDEVFRISSLSKTIATLYEEGAESTECLVGNHKIPLGGQLASAFERSEDGVSLSCSYCQCNVERVDAPAAPRCFIEDCSAGHDWCSVDSGLNDVGAPSAGGLGPEPPHPCCEVCPPHRPPSPTTEVQPATLAIDPSVPYTGAIYTSRFRHLPAGLCGGRSAVLLAVTSVPTAADRRALLRRLYRTEAADHGVQLVFLLGRSATVRHVFNDFTKVDDEYEAPQEEPAQETEAHARATQRAVDAEAAIYGDIIQSNVSEHYNHLTLKSVSLLDAMRRRCPQVRFIAKTDDDVFVNIRLLAREASALNATGFIYGQLQRRPAASRSRLGWYTSEREWPWRSFPPFVVGPGYLISGDAVDALLRQALRTRYHHLEDVFVTGIVAQAAGVARADWPSVCSNPLNSINVCRVASCVFTHRVNFSQLENTLQHLINASRRFPLYKMCQQPVRSR